MAEYKKQTMFDRIAITFAEVKDLSLEQLIASRNLQRDIHYLVNCSTRNKNLVSETKPYNPNPLIELKGEKSIIVQSGTFRIKDRNNLYFFDKEWAVPELPDFLRPEDIIYSGICEISSGGKLFGLKDISFNKPLKRVKEVGGTLERYNTKIQQWEYLSDQRYEPSLIQKVKLFIRLN